MYLLLWANIIHTNTTLFVVPKSLGTPYHTQICIGFGAVIRQVLGNKKLLNMANLDQAGWMMDSGQIIIFHQPGFPWLFGDFPY